MQRISTPDRLNNRFKAILEIIAIILFIVSIGENNQAGKNFGIQSIPTQIFYDAKGKELFRHEGFFAKEDILQKWKEFGVNL